MNNLNTLPVNISSLAKQYVLIRAVENIVVSRHKLQKSFNSLPTVTAVKLVCMTKDLIYLRLVGLHLNKFLAKSKHFIGIGVLMNGRLEFIKIALLVKAEA